MKVISSAQVTMLFRRRCVRPPNDIFLRRLVRDAIAEALKQLASMRVPHPNILHVVYGRDEQYGHEGVLLGLQPRHCWVRVETTVLSEKKMVPEKWTRNSRGFLQATYL